MPGETASKPTKRSASQGGALLTEVIKDRCGGATAAVETTPGGGGKRRCPRMDIEQCGGKFEVTFLDVY